MSPHHKATLTVPKPSTASSITESMFAQFPLTKTLLFLLPLLFSELRLTQISQGVTVPYTLVQGRRDLFCLVKIQGRCSHEDVSARPSQEKHKMGTRAQSGPGTQLLPNQIPLCSAGPSQDMKHSLTDT